MRGGGNHEHNVLARLDAPKAVDDADAQERPAPLGGFYVPRDLRLRHLRIMLERHGAKRGARLLAAADAGEGDDRAHVRTTAPEFCRFARGIERLALQVDAD